MPSTNRRTRRTIKAVVTAGLTVLIAASAFASAAPAEPNTSTDKKEVTCIGGGKVGQEIDVEITTTLPDGRKGKSKAKARCGEDGEWHVVDRTVPPTRKWSGIAARPGFTQAQATTR